MEKGQENIFYEIIRKSSVRKLQIQLATKVIKLLGRIMCIT